MCLFYLLYVFLHMNESFMKANGFDCYSLLFRQHLNQYLARCKRSELFVEWMCEGWISRMCFTSCCRFLCLVTHWRKLWFLSLFLLGRMLNTTGVIRSSEVLSFQCNINRRVYWIDMKGVTTGCAAGYQGWSWRGSQGRRGGENNEKKLTQKNLSVTSGHASLQLA